MVTAERGTARLPDGRTVGLLRGTDGNVAVAVRATAVADVDRLLNSVQVVDVDNAGCPTARPDALSYLEQSDSDTAADLGSVANATLCMYSGLDGSDVIDSSAVVSGAALAQLTDAIRALDFDNYAPDESCSDPESSPHVETLIALRLADGEIAYVAVAYLDCGEVAYAAHTGPATLPQDVSNLLGTLLSESTPAARAQ